jgi:two-component system chemotaxis response regulator CheY
MKILIAEDDMASRRFLSQFLSKFGQCDMTIDGMETVEAFLMALNDEEPYDLVCLDIMMPKVDGVKALKAIREIEKQKNIQENKKVKVIMTTALSESNLVYKSFEIGCDAYASKPIDTEKFLDVMRRLGLIK